MESAREMAGNEMGKLGRPAIFLSLHHCLIRANKHIRMFLSRAGEGPPLLKLRRGKPAEAQDGALHARHAVWQVI